MLRSRHFHVLGKLTPPLSCKKILLSDQGFNLWFLLISNINGTAPKQFRNIKTSI